ncbi:MAG: hypothetical protein EOR52_27700 [Mesorhizobium sp.]|uniref:hypothetical protein n=1 Tax=Mesorhizobium sp. TaxID=1871066 RepID=UPI000FE9C21C|nr:hypothetical protein [Mesorhizobium sp.]RWK85294.1 MAG: hypothetical protein EOR52_27700 [Mesorhizobium sp.]
MKTLTVVATFAIVVCCTAPATSAEFLDGTKDAIPPEILDAAVSTIIHKLRDPGSAQFQGLVMARSKVLCGFVNAKNGFGGYVGFTPFLYNPADRSASILKNHEDNEAWNELEMMVFKFTGCDTALGL